jgi:hypothetical protein
MAILSVHAAVKMLTVRRPVKRKRGGPTTGQRSNIGGRMSGWLDGVDLMGVKWDGREYETGTLRCPSEVTRLLVQWLDRNAVNDNDPWSPISLNSTYSPKKPGGKKTKSLKVRVWTVLYTQLLPDWTTILRPTMTSNQRWAEAQWKADPVVQRWSRSDEITKKWIWMIALRINTKWR